MKLKEVERVYTENFIVIEPGLTGLQKNQLLNEEEWLNIKMNLAKKLSRQVLVLRQYLKC